MSEKNTQTNSQNKNANTSSVSSNDDLDINLDINFDNIDLDEELNDEELKNDDLELNLDSNNNSDNLDDWSTDISLWWTWKSDDNNILLLPSEIYFIYTEIMDKLKKGRILLWHVNQKKVLLKKLKKARRKK